MKIIHITYSTSGGAGIAAYRLHLALLDIGIDSSILCVKNKIRNAPNVFVVEKPRFSIFRRLVHKISPIINSLKNRKTLALLGGNYEIASFPTSDYRIHEHSLIKDADIINLHWVGDFIDYPTFFKNCKIPIIWTLHDMNPFLGCFHYKYDDENNKHNFKKLNEKLICIKKKSYKKSSLSTIVAPSKWLLEESKKSILLGCYSHKHIYNGVDEAVFKPIHNNKLREELNFPTDKIIFLFVCQNIDSYRKGFDIIEGVINELNIDNILFVAIGTPPINQHKNIRYLGSINNPNKMAEIYNASDAFLLPSREDNLPNTMVESLLCGTPVIASNIGGMSEVIKNGENGFLIDEIAVKAFKDVILKFIVNKNKFNQLEISLKAQNYFSEKVLASNYLNLYKSNVNE